MSRDISLKLMQLQDPFRIALRVDCGEAMFRTNVEMRS